jgi:hypothetical protein
MFDLAFAIRIFVAAFSAWGAAGPPGRLYQPSA